MKIYKGFSLFGRIKYIALAVLLSLNVVSQVNHAIEEHQAQPIQTVHANR